MLILRLVRFYRGLRERKAFSIGVVLLMTLISLLGNATCFYVFEDNDEIGFDDALWYSVISITTIGYGDYYASSLGARLGTVVFIVVLGLATFSVFLGMSIDWANDWASKGQRGMSTIFADNHILIVNFPSATRVSQLIQELQSDPQRQGHEIVIVTDQIERLPFDEKNVLFVNGPILEQETYQRAKVDKANLAVVLATSYADANSDAVVASVVSVIQTINPNLYTVAECLNYKHRMLFDSVNCNAIVFSMRLSGNLLAQEAHDPGVSQLVDVITSNVRGTTLYSTEVTDAPDGLTYNDLAKKLLDHDVNMLCINRGDESLTSFISLEPLPGDRVIYATSERIRWSELLNVAET